MKQVKSGTSNPEEDEMEDKLEESEPSDDDTGTSYVEEDEMEDKMEESETSDDDAGRSDVEEDNIEDKMEESESSDDEAGKAVSVSSKISAASSSCGNNDSGEDKKQSSKRGNGLKWLLENEFDSMVEFDDSAVLRNLMDNYNVDNKTVNKQGHVIRTFVCKFSKKKKGFACPALFSTEVR